MKYAEKTLPLQKVFTVKPSYNIDKMNKKCMTLIVSALVTLMAPGISRAQGNGAASVGNMNLNLKKAIEIALAENPTIRVADKDIQLKEIADKEAWQALLPSVSASLSLSHSIQVAAIKTAMGEFKMGADGSTYKACEFAGETVKNMNISDRMVLCNMAIEMGGKTGLVEPDDKTKKYVESRSKKPYKVYKTDLDSSSLNIIDINVDDLEPQVACPHNVDNVKPVSEIDQEIDQVFLGSCTNGRLEDLRDAAKILKGNKIAKQTRMLVIPASKEVYSKALDEGLLKIFVDSGALVSAPCCGPCLGGHTGIIGPGEVSLSTSNRNFKGRQGSPEGKVYLSSAAVAAASAIEGKIVAPE